MIGRWRLASAHVPDSKRFGQVESSWNRGTLQQTADGIFDLDVDLGASKAPRIFIPVVSPALGSERVPIQARVASSQTRPSPIDFSGRVERLILVGVEIEVGEDLLR